MSQQLFYLAMTGWMRPWTVLTAAANNLANRGTTAFKAQKPVFEALPLYGQGRPDRVMVEATEMGPTSGRDRSNRPAAVWMLRSRDPAGS